MSELSPGDISYDEHALYVAGDRIPCDRPRLAFARYLTENFSRSQGTAFVGNGVTLGQHSVIGKDGFGFERDENGVPVRIPHFGNVIIGDRVEIGACTVIARGTIGDTVIGSHVKLDAMVFVAHNVVIGDCTLVVAGAVICGSAKIGKRCWIGANATIKEGIVIGDDCLIGMGAVVLKDVPPNSVMVGNPARYLRANK